MSKPTMPAAMSSKAPCWKGRPEDLGDFFEEFESLAAAGAGLTDAEKVKWVVRYVYDACEARFWKTLDGYESGVYDDLKKEVLEHYTFAGFEMLMELMEQTASRPMNTTVELRTYYKAFQIISKYLIKNGRISQSDADRHFWFGLPRRARREIKTRLQMLNPKWDMKVAPTIKEVMDAGLYIWSEDAFDAPMNNPAAFRACRRERCVSRDRGSGRREKSVDSIGLDDAEDEGPKRERGDVERNRGVETKKMTVIYEIEELARKLGGLDVVGSNYVSVLVNLGVLSPEAVDLMERLAGHGARTALLTPTSTVVAAGGAQRRPRPSGMRCAFCANISHRIKKCSVVDRYITEGKVLRTQAFGRIIFPNGAAIPSHPSGALKASVDEYWASQPR